MVAGIETRRGGFVAGDGARLKGLALRWREGRQGGDREGDVRSEIVTFELVDKFDSRPKTDTSCRHSSPATQNFRPKFKLPESSVE